MEDQSESTSSQERTGDLDWSVFAWLMATAVVASVVIVPYLLELMSATGDNTSAGELIFAIVFERVFLSALAIGVGLIVCGKLGRATTPLTAVIANDPSARNLRSSLLLALMCGLGVGAVIYLLDPILEAALMPELPATARRAEAAARQISTWKPLLASLSAGVTEELWFRFCMMTLFVWLGCRLTRHPQPGTSIIWGANFLAAILFGLLHLTNVIQLEIPITLLIVLYVVIWNGLSGVVFGWLYWQCGLVYAMLAHTIADVVLKVLVPMVETAT